MCECVCVCVERTEKKDIGPRRVPGARDLQEKNPVPFVPRSFATAISPPPQWRTMTVRRIVRTRQPRGNGYNLDFARRRDGDDDYERICRPCTPLPDIIYYFPGASIPQSRITSKASAYIHKRTRHTGSGVIPEAYTG